MKKDFLIFDFDGTIVESFGAILRILRSISKNFGIDKITDKDIERFKEEGVRQSIKDSKIPLIKIPVITKRVNKKFNKEITNLSLFPGLKEVFSELKKRKYNLGILTSNSKDNVEKFLERNNLDFFDFIYSDSSLFGKDKVLKKLLKKQKLDSNKVIYFGDEIRDIQAALKLNIKIVAVCWGFNTKKALKKYKPNYLIEKPSEILALFSRT